MKNYDVKDELKYLRRKFHEKAEIGWLEFETTISIIKYLRDLNYSIYYGREIHSERMGVPSEEKILEHRRNIKKEDYSFNVDEILEGYTGVVAVLDSKIPGPVIALRFDIDALNIQESFDEYHIPTKENFRSKNSNVMHACGHDGHIAIGLMVGKMLMENKDRLKGKIKLIFQPAEEGVRGAKSMVDAGALDDVDILLSGHIGLNMPERTVVVGVGGMYATSKIDIEFNGESSHAALNPEKGRNALLGACTCALNLQTIAQSGLGLARINVGVLNSGSSRNIIPENASLKIETRGEVEEINEELIKRVENIVEGAAKMYDLSYKIDEVGRALAYQYKENDFCNRAYELLKDSDFEVEKGGFLGASEDISYMLNKVEENGGKGLFMIFGTELKAPHHNSKFDFNENVLYTAYKCYEKLIDSIM